MIGLSAQRKVDSRHRQKVGSETLMLDRQNPSMPPEFDVTIDGKHPSAGRLPGMTMQLTCPAYRRVGCECEQTRPYWFSCKLQVAISSEVHELGGSSSRRCIHAEKVADIVVVESSVICSGLFYLVSRANPHFERLRYAI